MLNKSVKPIVNVEKIVFFIITFLCINILVADVFPPDAPVKIEINVSKDKIYVGDSIDVYATITLLKDHLNYVEGKKYRINEQKTYGMVNIGVKLIPVHLEKPPLWGILYSDKDKIISDNNPQVTFHFRQKLNRMPDRKNLLMQILIAKYPLSYIEDVITNSIEIECLEKGLEYKPIIHSEDRKYRGEGAFGPDDFDDFEPMEVDLNPHPSQIRNVKEINPELFKIKAEKVENKKSMNKSDNTPIQAEDILSWQYKTYIENKTEITTVFIKYDEDSKKQVKQFLNKEDVKLITEDSQYVAAIAPVTSVKKLIKTLGDKIEICGLRDDDTYLQEKRIDKLLMDWNSEDKGILKGFCHVDSIYIVSVIFTHPETKKRYTIESFLTEINGEFSCCLPEGEYKVFVETVKNHIASEKQRKKLSKDVGELKIVPAELIFKLDGFPAELEIVDITAKNGWLLQEKCGISRPLRIEKDSVSLLNIPMFTYFDYGTEKKHIIDYKIKFCGERENYPYLYYFYQLLSLDDYERTFEKSDEKVKISGMVNLTDHKIQPFELAFLSAKHQLNYIQTDSLGHFSAEVYPDVYAVTIVSLPRIKTDVKDVLVNSYREDNFKLEFTVVDSLPDYRCFPGEKVMLHQRYNYFTKSFKDLQYSTVKLLN